jgi:outer membrane biogenesis lipoprotein LolB
MRPTPQRMTLTASPRALLVAAVAAVLLIGGAPAWAHAQASQDVKKTEPQTQTRSQGVRTLEDINIEGEIAVPQVLFITSRDFRRYRDGLATKFRMSTLEVARSADLPTRLRIVAKNKEEEK